MNRLIDLYPYRWSGDDPEFLVAKRAPGQRYQHQWRMIAGTVKDAETAWEAALRELGEETGVQPVRFWTVPSLNHFYEPETDAVYLIPVFAAQLPAETEIILNQEHVESRWIQINHIQRYIYWPEQQRLMKLIHRILSSDAILEDWEIEVA